MAATHWFDRLHRMLACEATRRGTLRGTFALLTTLAADGPGMDAAKGKRRRKRRQRRQKCGREECHAAFTDPGDVAFCEAKCGRCRDRAKFCIVRYPEPTRATCCQEGQECCPVYLDGELIGHVCIPNDRVCCPDDRNGVCLKALPESTCCPPDGCVDTTSNPAHCGGCDRLCAADEECIDGACACPRGRQRCGNDCVDTTSDPNHCGGCNSICAVGEECVDSGCVSACGPRCTDPNRPDCCDGQCVNTRYHPHHCGRCNHRCERYEFCTSTGECRCSTPCCHSNDSGVCVGPWFCCTEPCSRCAVGGCLRWRDGIENGYCEERANTCQVIPELTYCPISDLTYDCCGPNETCGATACVPA